MLSTVSEDEKKLLIDLVELLEDAVGNLSQVMAIIERAKENKVVKSEELEVSINSLSIYARDYSFTLLDYVERFGKLLQSDSEMKEVSKVASVEEVASREAKEEGE